MPFVKLDCGILESSLWEALPDRHIFITALLMARPVTLTGPVPELATRSLEHTGWTVPPGEYGLVEAAGVGILRRAGVDKEPGLDALERLAAPDPESKSPEYEGRRLVRIDGGFIVLNFRRYRDKDHTNADRCRRWRQRHAATRRVTMSRTHVDMQAEAEAEEESQSVKLSLGGGGGSEPQKPDPEAPTGAGASRRFIPPSEDEVRLHGEKIGLPEAQVSLFLAHYGANGWRVGKNPMRSWHSAMSGWKVRWEQDGRPGLNGEHKPSKPAWQVRKDLEEAIGKAKDELRFMTEGPVRTAKVEWLRLAEERLAAMKGIE